MKMLNRDEILSQNDRARELVEVPEWSGAVYVQSLSADERDAFEESCIKLVGSGRAQRREVVMRQMRAKLVAATVVTEAGERLFSDDDVSALGAKNAAAVDRLFGVAQRLSKISDADMDDLEKNSNEPTSDASVTS